MSYRKVLRIKPFRDLWLGQAISQFGDGFYFLVFMFMIKKITGSTAMVGYVGAAEALPFLFLSPYAGVLADRMDRKRIMLLSDLISAGILAGFACVILHGAVPIWTLLLAPCLLSSTRVFFMPAKSGAVPTLVPPAALLAANAISMTTQNLMPMISLGLSATVLSVLYTISPTWFFASAILLDLISFLISAAYIFKLPSLTPDRSDLHEVRLLADFKAGLRFMRNRHDLKVMVVLLTAFRLMVAPFFVFYIASNELWFGGKPATLTWFEFSFTGAMIVSSWYVGKLSIGRPTVAFMLGLAVTGLGVAAMAFSPVFWLIVLWNIVCGLAVPVADVPFNTYMQRSVPNVYLGRVSSVFNTIATGVMPIGMAAGGFLVDRIGVVAGFLTMGIGMGLAALAGFLDRPFRLVEMPTEEPSSSAGVPEETPEHVSH